MIIFHPAGGKRGGAVHHSCSSVRFRKIINKITQTPKSFNDTKLMSTMPSTNHFYDLKLSCYHHDSLSPSLGLSLPQRQLPNVLRVRKESNSRHGNNGQGKAILRLRQFNNEAILWRFEMAFGFIAQRTNERERSP